MYRLIQARNPFAKFMGLAVGWGIPERLDVDATLAQSLPGWVIVAAEAAPLTITFRDLEMIRKACQGPGQGRMPLFPGSQPLILIGYGLGCDTVSAALISKVLGTPWAVAALDGTHTSGARDVEVWAGLMAAARKGQGPFIGTSTGKPQDGPFWQADRVLGLALGGTGDAPFTDVQEGDLCVRGCPEHGADLGQFALLSGLATGPRSVQA